MGIAQDFGSFVFSVANLPSVPWGTASYVYRLVGLLHPWRRGSWLLHWADLIGILLVSLVFGLAPFVSNALVGVLLFACACFWVLLLLSGGGDAAGLEGLTIGPTPIHVLVVLYWGIAAIATAFSPVKTAAASGWIKLSLFLAIFALMSRLLRSSRLRTGLIAVYLHSALVVSVYGVQQWRLGVPPLATWNDPNSTLANVTRAYSYLGNPNLLAGYLVPAAIFSFAAMFVWRSWATKALALTMFATNTACLVFTWSRGGWLGLVAGLFVLFVLLLYWWSIYLPRFWRVWLVPIVLSSLAGFLVVVVMSVETLRDRVSSIFQWRGDSSNNFRINVWLAALDMIGDRPIIGIGPGNAAFKLIYPAYGGARYSALSAYSIFLEEAVEMGLIGLSCFLWLQLTIFTQGWLQLNRLRHQTSREGFWLMAAIATLAGMLVHGLVDTIWYRPQVNILGWLAVALIASYYQPLKIKN